MVIDGIYYALGLLVGGAVTGYLTKPAYSIPFLILAVFCLWFFRDPDRQIPEGPVAVSPADGVVVAIKPEGAQTRISIFLNVFDVHVNRSPIAGKITKIEYKTGKFLVASREEATTDNEQNFITVEGPNGKVVFSQIAGLIARRIICYKKAGDTVQAGDRVGYIKFGSRVDMFLGPEWSIEVKQGQRVAGGTDIIARRK
ncbi:MAG: phosphatidylserine decarboxylase [Bryobacterales bacterium]|nr:phosphatidylserine decarboxylase [Bryobacterales bacterium]